VTVVKKKTHKTKLRPTTPNSLIRTAHMSVLMTAHICGTQYRTEVLILQTITAGMLSI